MPAVVVFHYPFLLLKTIVLTKLNVWSHEMRSLSCFSPLVTQVQESSDVIKEGRVRVVFTVPCEPPMESLIQNQHVSHSQNNTSLTLLPCPTTLLNMHPFQAHPPLSVSLSVSVEILCKVQSWLRSGLTPRHHRLPRLQILWQHLRRQRIQEEVSEHISNGSLFPI